MIFIGITFQTNYSYNKINLVGYIIIDHLGNPLFAAAKKIGRTEILVAEAIATLKGRTHKLSWKETQNSLLTTSMVFVKHLGHLGPFSRLYNKKTKQKNT